MSEYLSELLDLWFGYLFVVPVAFATFFFVAVTFLVSDANLTVSVIAGALLGIVLLAGILAPLREL